MSDQTIKVQLYTLSTCPWSRNTRAWLDDRHVAYDFVDYDLADEGMQARIQDEMMTRGASAFPFVKFGDSDFIVGFNPDAFARLLGLPRDEELEGFKDAGLEGSKDAGLEGSRGEEPEGSEDEGPGAPRDEGPEEGAATKQPPL